MFGISASQGTLTQEEINAEEKKWKKAFSCLGQSPHRFSLTDILEGASLPEAKLRPLDAKNLSAAQANAKRKGQDVSDICLHMGSSEDRLEFCVGASTCIRPSHDVYYAKLKRTFTGQELLRMQGVFMNDFRLSRHVTSQRQPYHMHDENSKPSRHVTSGVRHHHGRLQGVTSRHNVSHTMHHKAPGRHVTSGRQAVTSRQDVRRLQSGSCSTAKSVILFLKRLPPLLHVLSNFLD